MPDSPLRHAGFRRFLISRALSGAASWMQTVAAGYLVFRLSGSAVQVGFLAACAKGPSMVVGPLGGWMADRFDRRRLALVLSAAQIVPVTLLWILSATGDISTIEIFVLAFCSALPAGLRSPLLADLAPDLVPEPLSKRAMADSAATYNVARLAGPAIGGGLIAAIGVSAAFGVTALWLAGALVALWSIPAATFPSRAAAPRGGLTRNAVVMWRALLLRTLLQTALTFFVFVGPLEQIMPVVAAEHGDGAQYIGLLLGAIALGGLLANPIVRRLQAHDVSELAMLGAGLVLAGVLMIALALSRHLAIDFVAIVLIGATWEVIWVTESTSIHFQSPAGLSGQAMGLLFMVAGAAVALGSIFAGWVADHVGLVWSLTISGLALIVFGPVPLLWAKLHVKERAETADPASQVVSSPQAPTATSVP